MNSDSTKSLPIILYLIVLVFHFVYAAWLIQRQKDSLAVGKITEPALILFGLLMINGISLTAFFFPAPWWLRMNIFWHFILSLDELRRVRAHPYRWPFLVNHLIFLALLGMA